ncbi:alpha/beta hydrolase [Caldibacillus lycopersici]|uniref:Alpha/beta hydrolase n=1 Tax=Perspicuibacillus lycopersici TaxID=1325689 RepID=A0AAE3IVD9_9BACI|nr:alpha/beta hydrolase [Perspicuibacillus lycopersici]MCU9612765.1 alpha/beta hydrolase [Perspicuibacillus lycopersici]
MKITETRTQQLLVNKKTIGQSIMVNGIDVYFEHYPHPSATKTILCIHGFLSSTFSFRSLIPLLNKDYQILSVDLPPFGKSGKTMDYCYSYKNLAATIIELVDKLQLRSVILAGHSLGGQICLNMIHQQPKKFEKAILLASSGYLRKAKQIAIACSYLPFFHLLIKRKLARSGGVEGNLAQVVYDPSQITEEMVHGYLQPFIENDEIFRGLTKLLRDREGDLPSEVLQNIRVPCLLIWGDSDKIVPLSVGKRLHNDLPNSELVIMKRTSHLIPEEKPKETASYIKRFIDTDF